MAKLQRWKRREPTADTLHDTPDDTSVDDGSGPVDGDVDEPVDEALEEAQHAPEPEEQVDLTKVDPDAGTDAEADAPARRTSRLPRAVREAQVLAILQAAHPRQAAATAVFLGLATLAIDRPPREALVVAAAVLVGQAILGWHNDIVDRVRDTRHQTPRKPIADGRLEVGSVWYAVICAVLLVIPLSITTGVTAGTYYLAALAVGLLGNVALRKGRFSWVSWAAQFALYVPYLSYGGWGGGAEGDPPEPAMVVAFALLGVGVHVLRSIWGLVADDADSWTYLPLVLGRKLGATRLLAVATAYVALVLVVIAIVGTTSGLRG